MTRIMFAAQRVLTGDSKDISKSLITLEVEAENVPDLTLIDLPGITRVHAEGQSRDVPEKGAAIFYPWYLLSEWGNLKQNESLHRDVRIASYLTTKLVYLFVFLSLDDEITASSSSWNDTGFMYTTD